MPFTDFPDHGNFDDHPLKGQARETRSGSEGSNDSYLGGVKSSSLFGSSLDSAGCVGTGSSFETTLSTPHTSSSAVDGYSSDDFRQSLPATPLPGLESHLENGFQPLYQDQMTTLRSKNQPTTINDHVPQVIAPESSVTNGDGNHMGGKPFEHSSDDSSYAGGRSRSPSLLNNLCKEFDRANIGGGGGGGGPGNGHHLRSFGNTDGNRLLELSNATGYNIVQRNGQRIYGPPPGWGNREQPSKGCEVFVGRVPRDIFEPELVPVFERVGQIYELRLMMDFSGSNRGFFFVRYTCREDAKRACKELDNFEIRPHKRLGVLMSMDNNKLWLSGIPNGATADDIRVEIDALTEGVTRVILYPSPNDRSKPRKYAFVEYENHRAAALARRRLVPTKIVINGQEIEKVDWAEPQIEVDEEIMSTVKVLFVRNLTEMTSEDYLRFLFNQWSNGQVERVKKAKDYAFVHFYNRAAAEDAKRAVENQIIDGEKVEVEWSRPVDKIQYNTRKALTKLLSSPQPPPPMPMLQGSRMFGGSMMPQFDPYYNDGMRGIFPRKRGAAGIIGLGAPGTLPPRNLIKKLTGGPMMPMPPSPLMGNQYPNPNGGGNCMHHHAQDQQQHGLNGWPNGGMVPDNSDPVSISKAINEFKQSNQGGMLNGFQNGGPGMAPNHGPGAQETHGGNLYGHPANGGVAHPFPPPPHPFGPAAMYASQLAAAAAMSAANHPYVNPMAFYQSAAIAAAAAAAAGGATVGAQQDPAMTSSAQIPKGSPPPPVHSTFVSNPYTDDTAAAAAATAAAAAVVSDQ